MPTSNKVNKTALATGCSVRIPRGSGAGSGVNTRCGTKWPGRRGMRANLEANKQSQNPSCRCFAAFSPSQAFLHCVPDLCCCCRIHHQPQSLPQHRWSDLPLRVCSVQSRPRPAEVTTSNGLKPAGRGLRSLICRQLSEARDGCTHQFLGLREGQEREMVSERQCLLLCDGRRVQSACKSTCGCR